MKLTHDQIIEKLKKLGLIENDKLLSFARFSNRATIRRYIHDKVVFLGEPNKSLFGVYVNYDTDTNVMKEAYDLFRQLVKGNMQIYESGTIQWGNCKMPDVHENL